MGLMFAEERVIASAYPYFGRLPNSSLHDCPTSRREPLLLLFAQQQEFLAKVRTRFIDQSASTLQFNFQKLEGFLPECANTAENLGGFTSKCLALPE